MMVSMGPSEGGPQVDSVSVSPFDFCPSPTVPAIPTPTLASRSLETDSEPSVIGTPNAKKVYLPMSNQ